MSETTELLFTAPTSCALGTALALTLVKPPTVKTVQIVPAVNQCQLTATSALTATDAQELIAEGLGREISEVDFWELLRLNKIEKLNLIRVYFIVTNCFNFFMI